MDRGGGRKKSSHNPPKRCRGDTENGRECCRNTKYRRNIIDTADDADLDQQGDHQEAERGAQDVGRFQRDVKRVYLL